MKESTGKNSEDNSANSTASSLSANLQEMEEIMRGVAAQFENVVDTDPFNLMEAGQDWFEAMLNQPENAFKAGMTYWQDAIKLYHHNAMTIMGVDPDPVIQEEKGDRRFRHKAWQEQPVYSLIKQSYLLSSRWLRDMTTNVEGMDRQSARKIAFFTKRYIDGISPSNFALTNPAVVEKTIETNGQNLVNGLKNMLADLSSGDGKLHISTTDNQAFELGKNIAVTPGKVIYRNRMFELLQYQPATEKVNMRPLLIIPPWINKYYILDLRPENSLIKWMVDQGHTVFVISWVNPDASYSDVTFDDYAIEGLSVALDAVEKATGAHKINVIGYCIGGALLAAGLAYFKATGDERIACATFLTTMLDYSEPGELGVFIDQEQVKSLAEKMDQAGYLDSDYMVNVFNLLRANDLIWSFYVNNYLMGNDPRPFDLLYWNSDSTRMPAKMHSWYLKNFYVDNLLCQPGGIEIAGIPIDLTTITIPVCFVSGVDDHIAPWKSTYAGTRIVSGSKKFILSGSGHIAGIINPPKDKKYGYRATSRPMVDPEKWFKNTDVHEGSWWPEWQNWISRKTGGKIDARKPGDGALTVIENAPGSYVRIRFND